MDADTIAQPFGSGRNLDSGSRQIRNGRRVKI